MAEKILFTVFLFIGVTSIQCGTYCKKYNEADDDYNHMYEYYDYYDSHYQTIWCEHGCCGSRLDSCCDEDKTGMIIRIVVGSLVLVGLTVSILVAVFCCGRNAGGRTGQVNQPSNTQAVITVPMQNIGYGQVGYNGAVSHTVVTSNMTPGSVQTWQQPPPTYDQLNKT